MYTSKKSARSHFAMSAHQRRVDHMSILKQCLVSLLSVSVISCGEPLKSGDYLGEPFGHIEVLIQPYQALQGKWTDEENWSSVEATCLEESEACTYTPESIDCQVERSQCVQEVRARVSWIQNPALISFAILWLPISQTRSENTALSYLEDRGQLPQSPLRRASPDAPIPHQGALYLFNPPPESMMVEVDLTEQAYLAGVRGFDRAPSLLGIPVAFLDDDRDERFNDGDTLVGLALDQGVLYTQLASGLSAETLRDLKLEAQPRARTRGFMSRVNYPFCSTPEQWTVPDPRVTPLVISLLELESWVLDVELGRYISCEAGVSPQCGSRADLREVCEPSEGESEVCQQCYDQLINRYCGRMISKCFERHDDEGEDDVDEHLCDALAETCRLRSDCLHLDLLCEAPLTSEREDSWSCAPEESARCYQERSCLIEAVMQGDLFSDLWSEDGREDGGEVGLEELVRDEANELYTSCVEDGRYLEWSVNHPECASPWDDSFDLSEGEGERGALDPSCRFKECERVYLGCDASSCEDDYLSCVTLMSP